MGWSRGSELMESLSVPLREVPPAQRKPIYKALVKWANMEDWDTHDEAMGIDPVLDEILIEEGYVGQED